MFIAVALVTARLATRPDWRPVTHWDDPVANRADLIGAREAVFNLVVRVRNQAVRVGPIDDRPDWRPGLPETLHSQIK